MSGVAVTEGAVSPAVHATSGEPPTGGGGNQLECYFNTCHNDAEWLLTMWCGCLPAICNECLKAMLRLTQVIRDLAAAKHWECVPHARRVPKEQAAILSIRPI
jgi:hypothetical protein